MKKFALVVAVIVLGLFVITSGQAQAGEISNGMVAAMGLSGMTPMSDNDGNAVRGKFTRGHSGNSYTNSSQSNGASVTIGNQNILVATVNVGSNNTVINNVGSVTLIQANVRLH